jgi:hypothetical protein
MHGTKTKTKWHIHTLQIWPRDACWRLMIYTIVAQRFMLCLKNLKRIHHKLSRYLIVCLMVKYLDV